MRSHRKALQDHPAGAEILSTDEHSGSAEVSGSAAQRKDGTQKSAEAVEQGMCEVPEEDNDELCPGEAGDCVLRILLSKGGGVGYLTLFIILIV